MRPPDSVALTIDLSTSAASREATSARSRSCRAHTSSARSRSKVPAKTPSRANSVCSSGARRSWDQRTTSSRARWRWSGDRVPASSPNRASRRSATSVGRQRAHPGRSQLESERQSVEPDADRRDGPAVVLVEDETGPGRPGSRGEQGRRGARAHLGQRGRPGRRHPEGRQHPGRLARQTQGLAARGQDGDGRAAAQDPGDERRRSPRGRARSCRARGAGTGGPARRRRTPPGTARGDAAGRGWRRPQRRPARPRGRERARPTARPGAGIRRARRGAPAPGGSCRRLRARSR